jgi:hypothetical protein
MHRSKGRTWACPSISPQAPTESKIVPNLSSYEYPRGCSSRTCSAAARSSAVSTSSQPWPLMSRHRHHDLCRSQPGRKLQRMEHERFPATLTSALGTSLVSASSRLPRPAASRGRAGVDCALWSRQALRHANHTVKAALLRRPGAREGAAAREGRGSRTGNTPIDSLTHMRKWR